MTASATSSARPNRPSGMSAQAAPALLAVDEVGRHLGDRDARGDGVDPDARAARTRGRAARVSPMSPALAAL